MGKTKPNQTNNPLTPQKNKTKQQKNPTPANQMMSMNISVVCCKSNIFNKERKSEIRA